jgi:hypothetical protein
MEKATKAQTISEEEAGRKRRLSDIGTGRRQY